MYNCRERQNAGAQFARAQRLIARESRRGESVLVSLLVLLETEWVLRSRYGLAKSEIADALSALLDSVDLRVEDEAAVEPDRGDSSQCDAGGVSSRSARAGRSPCRP